MSLKKIIISILALFVLSPIVSSIGGGNTPHMENALPLCGETNVTITDKGIQTCIDLTVDVDCAVDLTFQWLNWSNEGLVSGKCMQHIRVLIRQVSIEVGIS